MKATEQLRQVAAIISAHLADDDTPEGPMGPDYAVDLICQAVAPELAALRAKVERYENVIRRWRAARCCRADERLDLESDESMASWEGLEVLADELAKEKP